MLDRRNKETMDLRRNYMQKRNKRAFIPLCGVCLWIFYVFQEELARYGLYTIISYNMHELAFVIPFLCMGTAVIWCGYLLAKAVKRKCDRQDKDFVGIFWQLFSC